MLAHHVDGAYNAVLVHNAHFGPYAVLFAPIDCDVVVSR